MTVVSRTAMHESYGACWVQASGSNLVAPLPWGPNGARLLDITPSAAINLTMPSALYLTPGGDPQFTVVNRSGTYSITVKDSSGTTIGTVIAGATGEVYCSSNATAAGSWLVRTATHAIGTALDADREPWEVELSGTLFDFDLQDHLTDLGWDGETPVAIRCTLAEGTVIGSTTTAAPAFTTGDDWPSGSTLLLVIGTDAFICGQGGAGGRGGSNTLLAFPGEQGGLALHVGLPTALVSYGYIHGGGGGGGGGARNTATLQAGGGGGGGCGYGYSLGGAGGIGTGSYTDGNAGISGSIWVAGGGGQGGHDGGTGGAPGGAGDTAGAAGGAAGDAVEYVTGYWTKIRAGTIAGSEVAV